MANTYVMGAGKVYVDLLDANDNPTGERYLGNTPGFGIAVSSETVDKYGDDEGVRSLEAQVLTQIDREATIQCDNVTMDNLALFIIGDKSTKSQGVATVTNEALTVKLGHFYQLGVSASDPIGARDVSALSVTDVAGTTTYVLNTDYAVDLALGRLEILSGGAITEGQIVHVDYTTGVETWEHVESAALAAKYAAIRYIASNRSGVNRDLYAPKVLLVPEGEFALKSGTDWQAMTFKAKFQTRGTLKGLYIDGRPV